jgi:hypothetical protein
MREILLIVWGFVTAAAALLSLPGSIELLTLSVASFLRVRLRTLVATPWSVVIVVPAHNEAKGIAACVASILASERDGMYVRVAVIADNCTDDTAELARAAGAQVLERFSEHERGKGYALDFAFTHPELRDADAFLVVDADTLVAPNFVAATAGALHAGADGVQTRYYGRNTDDSPRTRLMAVALRGFNIVRLRGRQNLGLSVGILGNGFGLRRETLLAVPYNAASVVEDLEYHLSMVRSGLRMEFVDDSAVFGEMAVGGKGIETQRSRWEGGRVRMIGQSAPKLLGDVLRGRWLCLEPLMELLLLPLAFHVVLLVVASMSPWMLPRVVGLAGLAAVLVHLAAAIVVGEGGWADVAALGMAPLYILWKVLLIPKLLRSARTEQAWVRTGVSPRMSQPVSPTRTFVPFALAGAFFAVLLCLLVRHGLHVNNGTFVYPLDDAYIHIAVSRNVALHGVWGISPTVFSGASSSPLWTLLLALVVKIAGVHITTPLVLNALAGLGILYLASWLLGRLLPRTSVAVITAWLLVLVLVMPPCAARAGAAGVDVNPRGP